MKNARIVLLVFAVTAGLAQSRKALVVGVGDYQKYPAESQLRYARADALRFADLLGSDIAGKIPTTVLTDAEATRETIFNAVDELRSGPQPEELVVFFSGHGEVDPRTSQLYLMPHEGDRQHLSSTAIPASEFINDLKAIGPKNLIIFLDACHSGAALGGKGTDTGKAVAPALDKILSDLNARSSGTDMFFVSAAANEVSWEDAEARLGIFTRYLVKGLSGDADGIDAIDGPKDGKVSAGELKAYLDKMVPARTRQLGLPTQTPIVSAEFDAKFVLTFSPLDQLPPTDPKRNVDPRWWEQRITSVSGDPELALMFYIAWFQDAFSPEELRRPEGLADALRPLLRSAHKMAALKSEIRVDQLTGSAITTDGRRMLTCEDPSDLLVIDLETGDVKRSSFALPPERNGRRAGLDSCEFSTSRDNSRATVSITNNSGVAQLWMLDTESSSPTLSSTAYAYGTFGRGFLAVSDGHDLSVRSEDGAIERVSIPISGNIKGLFGNPNADVIGAIVNDRVEVYAIPVNGKPPAKVADNGRESCVIGTGSFTSCVSTANGASTVSNPCGMCRIFETDGDIDSSGWTVMYQPSGNRSVQLVNRDGHSGNILIPEPIFSARLLANGQVVVVGQRGGIFRFDSVLFGDCCSLAVSNPERVFALAGGAEGLTVTLVGEPANASLEVLPPGTHRTTLQLGDISWFRHMVVSETNGYVAIVGDSKTNVYAINARSYEARSSREFNCGWPFAFSKSARSIGCISADGRVEIHDIETGKLQHDFDQDSGPIQSIAIGDDNVVAAGAYARRNRTLVSVWRLSDGKLLLQSTCPIETIGEERLLSILRRGQYFVEMETGNNLALRESLSCEVAETKPSMAVGRRTKELLTAPAADWVLTVSDEPKGFGIINPFESGFNAFVGRVRGLNSWYSETAIRNLALSADGQSVIMQTAGRVLRLPLTNGGLLDLAKSKISRTFTAEECRTYFAGQSCPNLLK